MKTVKDWHLGNGVHQHHANPTTHCLLVSHEILDEKGRDVGGLATIVVGPGDTPFYLLRVYATRDGYQYGASFPKGTRHSSLHAAQVAADAMLQSQNKRYLKKYGTK